MSMAERAHCGSVTEENQVRESDHKDSIADGRRTASPLAGSASPRESTGNPFAQRDARYSEDNDDDCEFQMMHLRDSSDERDPIVADTFDALKDEDEVTEQVREKIEKRADLLAVTLQMVISSRKPFCAASKECDSKQMCYKNDPFRKNFSHNSLLQLEQQAYRITSPRPVRNETIKSHERIAQFQEIRQRLLERGTSVSSQSGSRGASAISQKNLARPVVHENIYVYATDKTDRGIALAEKWRLTLFQPACSSNKHKSEKFVRRTSVVFAASPNKSSCGCEPSAEALDHQKNARKVSDEATNSSMTATEELKEAEVLDHSMPSVVIMEDDYFQTDAEEKQKSQIESLTQRVGKVAQSLPLNNLIMRQGVQAELRWEKTKDWNPHCSLQESDLVEVHVDNIGKILIQCEYISESQIKSHILLDKQVQNSITEAGLRKDSIKGCTGGARPGLFKFTGLSAMSGAFTQSPGDSGVEGRPRVRSDCTAQLAAFGSGLSSRVTNQLLTGSNESIAAAQEGAVKVPMKLRLDLMTALAPPSPADNTAGSTNKQDSIAKRMSDDSQNSQGGGFFSRIKSKFTEVINSARRSSFNVGDSVLTSGVLATTAETDRPIVKSRTMIGNPFLAPADSIKPKQIGDDAGPIKSVNRRMSELFGSNPAQEPQIVTSASNRPRVSSSFKAQAQHDFTNKTHHFEDANSNEYGASLSPANGESKAQQIQTLQVQQHQASDLMMRLSMTRSIGKASNLHLLAEDGTVIEINSQGSLGTTPDDSPNKLDQAEQTSDAADMLADDNDDFGYLVFGEDELANSLEAVTKDRNGSGNGLRKESSNGLGTSPFAAPLSTRSETEEEKALRFQIQLRQLKTMTQQQLKMQQAAYQNREESSFIQLSQEGQTDKLAAKIKAEFVNVLKVRKVIQKSLS